MKVQTLSQNLYVFSFPALKVSRDLTRVANIWFIDLSNCSRTLQANWGVICPYWNQPISYSRGCNLLTPHAYLQQFVEAFLEGMSQRRITVQLIGHGWCTLFHCFLLNKKTQGCKSISCSKTIVTQTTGKWQLAVSDFARGANRLCISSVNRKFTLINSSFDQGIAIRIEKY